MEIRNFYDCNKDQCVEFQIHAESRKNAAEIKPRRFFLLSAVHMRCRSRNSPIRNPHSSSFNSIAHVFGKSSLLCSLKFRGCNLHSRPDFEIGSPLLRHNCAWETEARSFLLFSCFVDGRVERVDVCSSEAVSHSAKHCHRWETQKR